MARVYTTQQTGKAPKTAFLLSLLAVLAGFVGMMGGDEGFSAALFFGGVFGAVAAKLWGWWAHG